MRIIQYNTEEEAIGRSHLEAINRGCTESSTTQYWWGVVEGIDGKWGVNIGNDVVEDDVIEVDDDWCKNN